MKIDSILIWDDELSNNDVFKADLKEKSSKVILKSSNDIRTILNIDSPNIVVIDLNDGNKGDEIPVVQIRKSGYKNKIIGLTTTDDLEAHHELINAGCDVVLSKPFSLDMLIVEIEKLINSFLN